MKHVLFAGILLTAAQAFAVTGNDKHNLCKKDPAMGVLALPADDGKHATPVELWFHYGELWTASGKHLAFHVYFFNLDFGAPFAFSTISVIDLDSKQGHQKGFVSATGFDTDPNRYDLSTDQGWQLKGSAGYSELHATLPGTASGKEYTIDLYSATSKNPVPQFHEGYIDYGVTTDGIPRGTQNLYSRPRMPTVGTVTIDGQKELAWGELWFDHQWGPTYQIKTQWTGIQLDNGVEVTVFEHRDLVTNALIDRIGTVQERVPGCRFTKLTSADVTLTSEYSPAIPSVVPGKVYPSAYNVSIPSMNTQLRVVPVSPNQEVADTQFLFAPIFQGASNVTGKFRGKNVTGFAFAETQ